MEKNKKDLLAKRASLVALSASLAFGTPVSTEAKGFFGNKSGEEIESALDSFFGWAVEADEKVNDVKDDLIKYKHDTLQIVTTMPTTDPSEDRDYHFLNTKVPAISKTYYLNAEGEEVKKKSSDALYRVSSNTYKDIENNDWMFEEKTITNLETFEVTTNTVLLSADQMYLDSEDSSVEYGLFEDIADILPEAYVSEKYTLSDVKWLSSDVLNNMDYDLSKGQSLSRTK